VVSFRFATGEGSDATREAGKGLFN
jgi:hypothetical protein